MADAIILGVILSAYGLRGQVNLRSFTAEPMDIMGYGGLHDSEGRIYHLSRARIGKGDRLIVMIDGVDTREQAEALRGTRLCAEREQLAEISDCDEFYHVDLLGLMVCDEAKDELGKVIGVYNFGGGDLLEIELNDGGVHIFAFTRANVPRVVLSSHIVISLEALGDVDG